MCDDTFNPLGIQGGGLHPLHDKLFVTSKLLQ